MRNQDEPAGNTTGESEGEGGDGGALVTLQQSRRQFIVAIGASAGGLEALSQLIAHLPADLNVPFVVLQHLSRIQSDLRNKDAAQLCLDAHTVKSLLAIFHGETARRLALDLESAARALEGTDWRRCALLADDLMLEMQRLKPELDRFAVDGAKA